MSPPATAPHPPPPGASAAFAPNASFFWNPALGLWGRPSPGHTRAVAHLPRVHSGVESAVKLHALLQLDQLDPAVLSAALRGLLDLQVTSGPFTGCFRWYAEEAEPQDTNASFFIGLALQLCALGHPARIPAALRPRLDDAFSRLNTWFLAELDRESSVYPNKYLGDLVCAWLGHELLDLPPPPALANAFARALAYWETTPWGWGEHQSDVYAGVLLTEFSALLLFARRLPDELRAHCLRLARDLLSLDDYYGSGPRVPQIRCYDFDRAPARLPFRTQVEQTWPAAPSSAWSDERARRRYMLLPFGPLFRAHRWSQLFPAPSATRSTPSARRIPLAAGATAQAWVSPGLRTGTLSRWPLLPGAEHQRWGLSWQTFPAAFWRPSGEWGFLRFTTRQGDDVRAHPALEKSRAYLSNALGPGDPPPVGGTACAQHGPDWIALRALPACAAWDEVSDGFWLHDLTSAPVLERDDADWQTLLLDHPFGPLRLHHFPAPGQSPAKLFPIGRHAWRWSASSAARPSCLRLWALTARSAPRTRPTLHLCETEACVRWPELHLGPFTLALQLPTASAEVS